jgi:hypothetical protein
MKIFFSFIVVIFSCASFAQIPAVGTADEKFISEQTAELSKSVVVLSRDILVYHWFTTHSANPENMMMNDPAFTNYAAKVADSFWRNPFIRSQDQVGWGLYAANDPAVSQSFGNSVLAITIKKGSRVLTKPLIFVCGDEEHRSTCEVYMREVVRRLKIIGFAYPYISLTSSICRNKFKGEAFLLFGVENKAGLPDLSNFEIKGMVPKKSRMPGEEEMYNLVGNFIQTANAYFGNSFSDSNSKWIDGFGPLTAKQKAEIRPKTWGCDNLYPEDSQ